MNQMIIGQAKCQAVNSVKSKVANLKEPILRKLLSGEQPTSEEKGYLEALEDVERKINEYLEHEDDEE